MNRFSGLIFIAVFGLFSHSAFSSVKVYQSKEPIVIDGVLNESEWGSSTSFELGYEISPRENAEATVQTKAYVINGEENLYIAIVATDKNPEKIRSSIFELDKMNNSDQITIYLNTFEDRKKAFRFEANPAGSKKDSIFSSSGQGNSSWSGDWHVAGKITETGYVMEFAIPFSILRYSNATQQKWTLGLLRKIPRNEKLLLSLNQYDRSNSCYECQLTDIELEVPENTKAGISLIPTISASNSHKRPYPYDTEFESSNNTELGMDLIWDIDSSKKVNATINPDFSNVELDSIQFDINERFALYYPEKRPFFLDGSNYFSSRMSLIHTRNITDPNVGLKYTGESDGHSTGIFVTDDQVTNIVIPGREYSSLTSLEGDSNNLAARYLYSESKKTSYGATATSRYSEDYSNNVISGDIFKRVGDSNQFAFQVAHSETKYPDAVVENFDQKDSLTGESFLLSHGYYTKNYSANSSVEYIDDDFRSDLGIVNQTGIKSFNHTSSYIWFADKKSFWTKTGLRATLFKQETIDDLSLSNLWILSYDLSLKNESSYSISSTTSKDSFNGVEFELTKYDFSASFALGNSLRLSTSASTGDNIDFINTDKGESKQVGAYISYEPTSQLQVILNFSKNDFLINEGTLFSTESKYLKVNYHFNKEHHLRLIAQRADIYQNASLMGSLDLGDISNDTYQLVYKYQSSRLTSFYAGFSTNYYGNDFTSGLRETKNHLFAKYSYNFEI